MLTNRTAVFVSFGRLGCGAESVRWEAQSCFILNDIMLESLKNQTGLPAEHSGGDKRSHNAYKVPTSVSKELQEC